MHGNNSRNVYQYKNSSNEATCGTTDLLTLVGFSIATLFATLFEDEQSGDEVVTGRASSSCCNCDSSSRIDSLDIMVMMMMKSSVQFLIMQ